jgi:outer membrane protein assembly factor BamD (BamD/ComL family)
LDEQGPQAQWVKCRLAQLYIHNGEWDKAKDYLTKIDNQYVDDKLKSQVKKLKKRLKKLKN